ncbi:MAG: ZIP family metal transporter [Clostridia bacterium]
MSLILGILIPFFGTTLGSSMVLFMKDKINEKLEKVLLGFASGVMIAASVWSLLIPAIEMAKAQKIQSWIPTSVGFMFGIIFLLLINRITEKLRINDSDEMRNVEENKNKMMILAITLHNIPEGMAVGVALAGALVGNVGISIAGAIALSIGIAIQNFPEGAIVSMPLKAKGYTRRKSFLYGTMSGIVEPIGAIITLLLTNIVVPILPYLLSFAAGTMIYVVIKELVPESQKNEKKDIITLFTAIGFVIMMILDITLG